MKEVVIDNIRLELTRWYIIVLHTKFELDVKSREEAVTKVKNDYANNGEVTIHEVTYLALRGSEIDVDTNQ